MRYRYLIAIPLLLFVLCWNGYNVFAAFTGIAFNLPLFLVGLVLNGISAFTGTVLLTTHLFTYRRKS